jgi:hypothetical protein
VPHFSHLLREVGHYEPKPMFIRHSGGLNLPASAQEIDASKFFFY